MTIAIYSPAEAQTNVPVASKDDQSEGKNGYRSRGWTPLKYPKSAIAVETPKGYTSQPYFPLHRAVLLAAVRELLVLDGTLDSNTLKVSNEETATFRMKSGKLVSIPLYKRHLSPKQWPICEEYQQQQQQQQQNETAATKNSHNATSKTTTPKRINHSNKNSANKIGGKSLKRQRGTQRNNKESNKVRRGLRGERIEVKNRADNNTHVKVPAHANRSSVPIVPGKIHAQSPPNPEELSSKIASRALLFGNTSDKATTDEIMGAFQRPVRKVSEADQFPTYSQISPRKKDVQSQITPNNDSLSQLDDHTEHLGEHSSDVCQILDLNRRDPDGSFQLHVSFDAIPDMMHSSITNEARLRDAAMSMTYRLVESVPDKALRIFFGYKSPSVPRERLIHFLAGLLFDTSHAMFAWEQTERELRHTCDGELNSTLDATIQQSLFDERALKKIGGFTPASLLPHAISITRLERFNVSWEYFAKSSQGKQMLEHFADNETLITTGVARRGKRLRQRHWLTSALLWQENPSGDLEASTTSSASSSASLSSSGLRSRSCSIASSDGDDDSVVGTGGTSTAPKPPTQMDLLSRRARIAADMPGAKVITLIKDSPNDSWGVCLSKEGDACVIGRAKGNSAGRNDWKHLRCGDLILYARNNERGQEASSPLYTGSTASSTDKEDWFRAMVDLFKTSEDLQLVIQRV